MRADSDLHPMLRSHDGPAATPTRRRQGALHQRDALILPHTADILPEPALRELLTHQRRGVLHFHRLLHRAFVHAVKWQLIARNVIDAVEPPRVEKLEMRALTEGETAKLIAVVKTSRVYVAVMLALTTGLRRGEVLALRWADIDLDSAGLAANQSLEQTRGGLRFKAPKTSKSRRAVALPALAVEILREHRIAQTKERLALGPAYEDNGLVCARQDGSPWPPDTFSTAFASLS